MIPSERSLAEKLKDAPFALLGVNSDKDRADVKKQSRDEWVTWRSWFDGGTTSGPIASRWNVRAWPTTYLIDARGVIRRKNPRDDQQLERVVRKLLAEDKGAPTSK